MRYANDVEVVDAMPWTGTNAFALLEWRRAFLGRYRGIMFRENTVLLFNDAEAVQVGYLNDFIICFPDGRFVACAPDWFHILYPRALD